MSYEQLEILFRALGVLLALIITFVIKPYIDSEISATDQETIKKYIEIGVRCAEQIFTPEQWEQKKEYVLNYVTEIVNKKLHTKLTQQEISTLIEGMVFELKKG